MQPQNNYRVDQNGELLINDVNYGVSNSIVKNVQAYWWPIMYGKLKGNSFNYWMIGTDGTYNYTVSGMGHIVNGVPVLDGVMKGPKSKKVVPKRGKTTLDQAVEEIKSKINDRQRTDGFRARSPEGQVIRFDYNEKDNDITFPHPEPMLAEEYSIGMQLMGHWLAQLKLDGNRCLAMIHNGVIVLISRGNKEFLFMDHIKSVLAAWFQKYPTAIFDGELYRHGMSANKIRSIVSKSQSRHPEAHLMEYHIYDIIVPGVSYLKRYEILLELALWSGIQMNVVRNETGVILSVETTFAPAGLPVQILGFQTVTSMEQIAEYHLQVTEKYKYEGLILRQADAFYDSKRVSTLLKYKSFEEEETEVIGVTNGSGVGQEADLACLQVRDRFGHIYIVRPRGSHNIRRLWLQKPELVVGRRDYVVTFFGRSVEYGAMRFPIGKDFRTQSYW